MRLHEQEAAYRRLSAWAKKMGREDWVDSDREWKKHRERNRARDHESESGRGLEEGNRAHSHGCEERMPQAGMSLWKSMFQICLGSGILGS